MSERLLSSGDVCEVAGIEAHVLNEWCRKGIVTPVEGGEGQGSHRRFTLMQALGLAVGAKVYASERSCVLSFVGLVVSAFAAMTEAELVEAFRKRPKDTHLMTICKWDNGEEKGAKPILAPNPYGDRVDVKKTYLDAKAKVAEIEHRLKDHVGGRTRGLAGASKHPA